MGIVSTIASVAPIGFDGHLIEVSVIHHEAFQDYRSWAWETKQLTKPESG